jgi:hypothetical protein
MRHEARHKDGMRPPVSSNECGVFAYRTRADARRRISNRPDIIGHLRAYKCRTCNLWHIGHLPQAVIDGIVTADEWYGANGHPPYGEILTDAVVILASRGIYKVKFHRGPDGQSWGLVARASGHDVAEHGHPDPVTATAAMLAQVTAVRAELVQI